MSMEEIGKDFDQELYGDLAQEISSHANVALQEKASALEKQNSELLGENKELKAKLSELLQERETVEKNLMSVFLTAQNELARKNREISDLQEQLKRR